MNKKLVLINGAPASGKSRIVRFLRENTDITIVEKDVIKEFFFDYIGYGDREWSKALGKAAVDAMFALIIQLFKLKNCLIVENAFYHQLSKIDLERIRAECDFDVLEIYCELDEVLRRERFAHRANNGRHAGHADLLSPNEATDNLDRYRALNIGPIMRVDTKLFDPETQGKEIIQKIKTFTEEETI